MYKQEILAGWDHYFATRLKPIADRVKIEQLRHIKRFYLAYIAATVIDVSLIYLVFLYVSQNWWIGSLIIGILISICIIVCSLVIPASVGVHYANYLKSALIPAIAEFFGFSYQSEVGVSDMSGLVQSEVEPFKILPQGFSRFRSEDLFYDMHENKRFRFSEIRTVWVGGTESRSQVSFKGVGLLIELPKPVPSAMIVTNTVERLITKIDFSGISSASEFADFKCLESNVATDLKFFGAQKERAQQIITPQFLRTIEEIRTLAEQINLTLPTKTILDNKWLFPQSTHAQLFRIGLNDKQALILFAVSRSNLFELSRALRPTHNLKAATFNVAQQLALIHQVIHKSITLS